MYWECALYADSVRKLANSECLADAGTLATDDDALEDLDTALVTFDNANVNLDFISGAEVDDIGTE